MFIWQLVPLDFIYKGVYPQSDESLAIVDIDASEGFVDLLVHLRGEPTESIDGNYHRNKTI